MDKYKTCDSIMTKKLVLNIYGECLLVSSKP